MYTNIVEIKRKKEKFTISLRISEEVIIVKEISLQELMQINSEIDRIVKETIK